MEKTMVKQAVLLQPMEDDGGAEVPPAAHGEDHGEAGCPPTAHGGWMMVEQRFHQQPMEKTMVKQAVLQPMENDGGAEVPPTG
ncbi:hypothetical protein GRJ2_002690500 [Grus japonensis]|uniref:Uncharacterized protein n=1 Tax=Grus japonensis TaxID=30415 RepID=A0ABC9XXK0_GRUJA